MAEIADADLRDMRALFSECRALFRRLETTATRRLDEPLSLVEIQKAQKEVDLFKTFAEACARFEGSGMQKVELTET